MKLQIEVDCDNASFEEDLEKALQYVLSIAAKHAVSGIEMVKNGQISAEAEGSLYDENGNQVGAWKVTDAADRREKREIRERKKSEKSRFTEWLKKHGHKDLCPKDDRAHPLIARIAELRMRGGTMGQVQELRELWLKWRSESKASTLSVDEKHSERYSND